MSTYDELFIQQSVSVVHCPPTEKRAAALYAVLQGRDVPERRMFLEQLGLIQPKEENQE